jgi:hypothetical protein
LDYQSRPSICAQKKRRDRLIRLAFAHPTWALGFADEVWWSRLAQPDQHRWVAAATTPQLQELRRAKDDPDPKALACYGLLVRRRPQHADQMLLRFVAGRPVSAVTTALLAWSCARLARQGVTARLLIWDTASWHTSQAVREWIGQHNRSVKAARQGMRIVSCRLPAQSPWLNPIEPKWVHGKRATAEPDRVLRADELETRVCAYYGCQREAHLVVPEKVA